MMNIINMALAAKGPSLSSVAMPKSHSQEFHSILRPYRGRNGENMPLFMSRYLLMRTCTGLEVFPPSGGGLLSVKFDEYVFTVYREPP